MSRPAVYLRNGKPSMHSRQRDIALALGADGALIGIEDLRRACTSAGCYSSPNFTKYMKIDSAWFEPAVSEGRIIGWRLKRECAQDPSSPEAGALILASTSTPAASGLIQTPTIGCVSTGDNGGPCRCADERDDQALMHLIEEENAALRARDAERSLEIESLRQRERAAEERAANAARAEVVATRAAPLKARQPSSAPKTVLECIDAVERILDDRVVFTDQARQSARSARINELPSEMPTVLRCVRSVGRELHDILLGALRPEPGTVPQKFQKATGFEMAMTESRSTNRDEKLARQRKLAFEGEEIKFSAHVVYGNKAPRLLRVHFGIHQSTRRIVVGWCGDHMPTAGTRRKH